MARREPTPLRSSAALSTVPKRAVKPAVVARAMVGNSPTKRERQVVEEYWLEEAVLEAETRKAVSVIDKTVAVQAHAVDREIRFAAWVLDQREQVRDDADLYEWVSEIITAVKPDIHDDLQGEYREYVDRASESLERKFHLGPKKKGFWE